MEIKEKETLVQSFNTIRKVCESTQGDLAYHKALAGMLDRVAAVVQEKMDEEQEEKPIKKSSTKE